MEPDVRCVARGSASVAWAPTDGTRVFPGADLINVFESFLPQLLRYPNPSDPLNGEAAALLLREPDKYAARIREYVKRYATPESGSPPAATPTRSRASGGVAARSGTIESDVSMGSLSSASSAGSSGSTSDGEASGGGDADMGSGGAGGAAGGAAGIGAAAGDDDDDDDDASVCSDLSELSAD